MENNENQGEVAVFIGVDVGKGTHHAVAWIGQVSGYLIKPHLTMKRSCAPS